jgi:hypothetical protein
LSRFFYWHWSFVSVRIYLDSFLVFYSVSAQAEYLDEDVDDYDEEISEPEAKALLENGDVEVEEVDEDLEAPEEVKKSPPPSVSRDASPAQQ